MDKIILAGQHVADAFVSVLSELKRRGFERETHFPKCSASWRFSVPGRLINLKRFKPSASGDAFELLTIYILRGMVNLQLQVIRKV